MATPSYPRNSAREHRTGYGPTPHRPIASRRGGERAPEADRKLVQRNELMAADDEGKELLEKLLAELYAKAATAQGNAGRSGESYLIAADNQYLGKITDNSFDQKSILNEYGPFGSAYSQTSIFNSYSPYGSEFGAYSVNNPYCTQPPSLFLNGRLVGAVSANSYVPNSIPTESFLYNLRHNIQALLRGELPTNESETRKVRRESFIQGADGTFLGSLNPNNYDSDSIFNKYGNYGSKYGQNSIFNKYSGYGGHFSPLSPFNSSSQTPPRIFSNGREVGFLTTNTSFSPRIDPNEIFQWAQRHVRKTY
jgi:hypothetical protein